MPLTTAEISLVDYKKSLAKDLLLAATHSLPFRLYQDFTFSDGKKAPLKKELERLLDVHVAEILE